MKFTGAMTNMLNKKGAYYNLRKVSAAIVLAFTVLLGTSLIIDLRQVRNHTRELAKMEARTTFNKDRAFRLWATEQGGVYVPPTVSMPPNPYLSHVPDRDIELPSGKRLTLVNPAYMMRKVMEEYDNLYGVKGHITSLKLMNPDNKPDAWERKALMEFEGRTVNEVFEFSEVGSEPYLRLMKPMYIEKGCLKCHGYLGYKIGDVRGGVSVSLPMKPYLSKEKKLIDTIVISHTLALLLGLSGIGFAYKRGKVSINERIKAEESIRSKEERFRNIVETTNDFIWEVDENGAYTYVSPKVRNMLGYEPEELIGKKPFDLMPPDEAQRVSRLFMMMMDSRRPFTSLESTNFTKDGRLMVLESNGTPFFDDQGAVRGYRGIDRDITWRKNVEKDLKNALDELTRSNAELQQFAYVASHDLQEPLRMVSSYLQLLSRKYKGRLDSNADEFIGHAVDGATRMDLMIKDLLELSRVHSTGEKLEPVDSGKLLEIALSNLSASIQESGAVVRRGHLPWIKADAAQIIRLFQNLISNAIKFRKAGEPSVIEINAEESEDDLVFSVKDNGQGIAPEFIEKIFVIFQRLHGSRYPGTGIGLAICKKIVERHGGRIWAESEPGKGSTFFFVLPRA